MLKDLCRVITPDYAAHWKVIGALLGLPTTCLDATETENPTNLQWCCNNMLKMWLARNADATWKDVLSAVDSPDVTQGVPLSSDLSQNVPVNGVYTISKSNAVYTFLNTSYVHTKRAYLWSLFIFSYT